MGGREGRGERKRGMYTCRKRGEGREKSGGKGRREDNNMKEEVSNTDNRTKGQEVKVKCTR